MLGKLFQGHLVIVGLRVTQLCHALRHQCQQCLLTEHSLCLGFGRGFAESVESKHTGDVLFVGITDGHSGSIVVQIIVFLSQCESTLHQVEDIHGHILFVGTEVRAKLDTITLIGIFQLQAADIGQRACTLNLVEYWFYRCDTLAVAAIHIQRQFVEVRQFALYAALLVRLLLQVRQDGVDALVVVFLQLVEAAESAIGCRQRIVFLPAAGGKLIEIVGRFGGLVQIRHDQPRFVLSHAHHWSRRHENHR